MDIQTYASSYYPQSSGSGDKASIIYQLLGMTPVQQMVSSLDSLINQWLPIRTLDGKAIAATSTGAAKAQVIEAIVLSSTTAPLTKSSQDTQSFRIRLAAGDQQYEIASKVPLPDGTKIQLKIGNDHSALLLKVLGQAVQQNQNADNTTRQAGTLNSPPSQNPAQHIIENHLRQVLPQQQPLKSLLPLLQNILQNPPANWPKELTPKLTALLHNFPKAENLQQPAQLKQAIQNSGIFFESKLAKHRIDQVTQTAARTNGLANQQQTGTHKQTLPLLNKPQPTAGTPLTNAPPIQQDLKLQLQQLLPQIQKIIEPHTAKTHSEQPASGTATGTSSQDTTTTNSSKELLLQLNQLFDIRQTQKNQSGKNTGAKHDGVDIVLRQLGKQLLSTLARTQLNQLETLSNRAQFNADNQGPANSWTLELPIFHGKHIDNLELIISEERQQQEQEKQQTVWSVMLNFDLHDLGKMNVQLKVIQQSVSATIWSQQQHTHSLVKQQINQLQANLEKVGVAVKQVDCYLGSPPKNVAAIHRQLVDVRT